MKSVKITLSVAALVAANLVPLVGVLSLDWDAGAIVLLYWAENLVVGFYTVLRFVFLKMEKPVHHLGKLPAIPFFCMHFGGFCSVHGTFLLGFLKLGDDASPFGGTDWPGPFGLVQMVVMPIEQVWNCRPPGMEWPLICLFVSHGISFVRNYLIGGECRSQTVDRVMKRPYSRIVLMHVTVIGGMAPVMLLGSPLPLLIILVALKIVVDIALHDRSHRQGGEAKADGRAEGAKAEG